MQVKIWHEKDDYCNNNEIVEWYNDYKRWKPQKTQINEKLLSIDIHPLIDIHQDGGIGVCQKMIKEKQKMYGKMSKENREVWWVSGTCFWLPDMPT